jgi:hypothetical protein
MNVVVDSTDIIKSQNAYSDKCGEVKSLSFQIAKKDLQIQSLTRQLEVAEKGLKGIRDHKHKESWGVRHTYGNKNPECVSYDERESINSERGLSTEDGGRMQGHRCAAKLASETLVEMEKCECGK